MNKLVEQNKKALKKQILYQFIISVVVTIIIAIITYFVVENMIYDYLKNKESDIIQNIIREHSKDELLIPPMILSDLHNEKEIRKELNKKISVFLSTQYANNTKNNDIKIKPYFIYPEKDYNGKYVLNNQQLEELKNHVNFLSTQIDKAIQSTKDEINKEIDRLNTWVSIWIFAFGIFGALIPFGINSWKKSEFTDLKKDVLNLKNQSENIIKLSETAQEQSEQASINANRATADILVTNRLLSLNHAIGKLNAFNPDYIIHIDAEKRLDFLVMCLRNIHSALVACRESSNSLEISDCLIQLGISLYNISYSNFIERNSISELNNFTSIIAESIDLIPDVERYNEILSQLDGVIINLSSQNL